MEIGQGADEPVKEAKRNAANPDFPRMLAAARERRALIAWLAAKRRELEIPQAEVAIRVQVKRGRVPSGQ